jgi:AcrR family transcriptional regulator
VTGREKALEAALRLFASQGYSATTIEDVKQRSGVSVGVIYHHFGSKEGIAGALYVESLSDFQRGLVEAIGRKGGAEAAIRAGVDFHLAWMDANRDRASFMLRRRETEVAEASQAEVAKLNRQLFAELGAWYRALAEAGEIRALPAPLLYAIWFGPSQEYGRSVLDGPLRKRGTRLAGSAPALADAAWAALRP